MLDATSFDAALKEYYTEQKIEELTYQNRPFMALLPKKEDFYGDVLPVVVHFGNPQGRSASFAQAKKRGALSNSLIRKFLMTRVKDYGYVTIDNETMEASANDRGAFMSARTVEIDGMFNSLSQSLATALTRDGYGQIGQIKAGSSVAGTTLTLEDPQDIVNFEVGMELMVAAAVSSGTLRAVGSSTNGLIVTGIDRDAGTLTLGFNANDATNGIPTIAASDYLFIAGDRENAASPVRLRLAGFEAWIPRTAPTSAPFFGVDRTIDVTRLAGLRPDLSGLPIEEAVQAMGKKADREGATYTDVFLHPDRWGDLSIALGSKVQFVDVKANASLGFRAIKVHAPWGDVNVLSDRTIPYTRMFGVNRSDWVIHSLGKLIKPMGGDGLKFLRLSSEDGVESRWGYYANMYCRKPRNQVNANIGS